MKRLSHTWLKCLTILLMISLCALLPLPVSAAEVQGDLVVEVLRADNDAPLANAQIVIQDREGKRPTLKGKTDPKGHFRQENLVLGDYRVEIILENFESDRTLVRITPGAATVYKSYLDLPGSAHVFKVQEDRILINGSDPKDGAVTRRDRDFIDQKIAEGNTLQGVLVTVPGIQRNTEGQFHARGEEKSVTFSMDGVDVPIPLTSSTTQPLDPDFFESLQVRTGNFDASQVGSGAIINAATLGPIQTPFVEYRPRIGTQGTFENMLKIGGSDGAGNFSYYLGAKVSSTDLGLESPSPRNQTTNNHADRQSYLLRLADTTAEDQFGFNLSFQSGHYQLPQTVQNAAAGVAQDQFDTNILALLSWKRKLNDDADLLMALAYLKSRERFTNNGVYTPWTNSTNPDLAAEGLPLDPTNPGSPYLASSNVILSQIQPSLQFTQRLGDKQRIVAGMQADFIGSQQNINISDPGAGGGLPDGAPQYRNNIARQGFSGALYFSHTLPLNDEVTLNYGFRADTFDNGISVNTGQISPLINFSWAPSEGQALRWSYNRLFLTPPLEVDYHRQHLHPS